MRIGPPFGDPTAGIVPILIKFIKLCLGVEHAKVRRGIRPRPRRPLPPHRIARGIPVDKTMFEPFLADPPMAHQMFRQIAGHDHAAAVVHPSGHVQFAHCGIDKRLARAPLFPGLNLGTALVLVPWKGIPFLAPVIGQHPWRVIHQVAREFAPNQFFKEGLSPLFTILQCALASVPTLVRADLAERQVL